MRFLLDTNIVLHYVRGDALHRLIERIYALLSAQNTLYISVVTVGEIRVLARTLGWGREKRVAMERFLQNFNQIPIPFGSILGDYVDIATFCRQNGRVLSKNDLWIAATARATGATLLTTDRDFEILAPDFIACQWINPVLPPAPPVPTAP